MKKATFILSISIIAMLAALTATAQDFVYILPSKEIAETSEDLWFKAYLMDRQTFALSDKSQTLYLQIRTATDSVVWSEKYPLIGGRCTGHIYVGDDWPQGDYYLEGYTKSSFTTDSTQAIRPRRIRVVERVAQMDEISAKVVRFDSIQKNTTKHRFDLFPEGGNLIDGINSVVAFKATYGNGFPDEVSGKVFEDGKQIAEIKCVHDGMGGFAVTPQLGKKYEVVLDDGRTYPFPEIERNGLALRVTRNTSAGITLLVSASDTVPHSFTIVSKLNGLSCGSANGVVKGKQIIRLPIALFPFQGIVEITLQNADGQPVAERLVYVNPEQNLTVSATTDEERYHCRDVGKVRLQVTDTAGQPVKAELAVSIFDKAYLYLPGHENILSHSHLSEQIRGNIFNPTYYFDIQNDNRLEALDLLLMTQGWRRYVWTQEPTIARPLLTDCVKGTLTIRRDDKSKMHIVNAFSPNGDTCAILTDSSGRFEIVPQQMREMQGKIYLKPFLTDKYKAKIAVENPFDTINLFRQGRERYLTQNQILETDNGEQFVFSDDKVILLDDVVVKAKRSKVQRDKVTGFLDSLANVEGMGLEWVCFHVNQNDFTDTLFILNDYLPGFTAHPESPNCEGKIGKPIPGETYTVLKVHTYIDGVGREGHVWYNMMQIVYPKRNYSEERLMKMYGLSRTQGYYPKREFYQPDEFDLAASAPDPRNLLQWQPSVMTDDNGVAEITFAASDLNTEFIGIVEAIDGSGLMGCQTFTFRVLKK
ncbi:MAG: hypothetical protein IKZ99_09345 [Salinivirgaceae bacterium]|nr:hypothetical protein [Salinivirgaceae bacterium]